VGHPIVGDLQSIQYVGKVNSLRRLALHLAEVRTVHPESKDLLNIRALAPAAFHEFVYKNTVALYEETSGFDSSPLNENAAERDEDEESDSVRDIEMYQRQSKSSSVKFLSVQEFLDDGSNKNRAVGRIKEQ